MGRLLIVHYCWERRSDESEFLSKINGCLYSLQRLIEIERGRINASEKYLGRRVVGLFLEALGKINFFFGLSSHFEIFIRG